ncbi:uncharacterized protein LOC104125981, partial [Egretta garzetta]|uniref:uncharacterized protein LOC104125981 n=1 Tax=Egretta garzetta TaxID=188379 RepID=UPI00163D353B
MAPSRLLCQLRASGQGTAGIRAQASLTWGGGTVPAETPPDPASGSPGPCRKGPEPAASAEGGQALQEGSGTSAGTVTHPEGSWPQAGTEDGTAVLPAHLGCPASFYQPNLRHLLSKHALSRHWGRFPCRWTHARAGAGDRDPPGPLGTRVLQAVGPRVLALAPLQAEEVQQQIIREVFHLVLKRDDHICNFLECGSLFGGSDYKLIYRHYATLYFVFCVDSSESELGILDLIQVFVETLDKCFENVCELDLIFHMDKVHHILQEVVIGGMVLETNMNEIVAQVEAQSKLEKAEVS